MIPTFHPYRELMVTQASLAFQDLREERDPQARSASQVGLGLMDTPG